jgi:hypothetical protein
MSRKRRNGAAFKAQMRKTQPVDRPQLKDGDKDWDTPCQICGAKPTVHPTELCGPCCFGEAATAGGNW